MRSVTSGNTREHVSCLLMAERHQEASAEDTGLGFVPYLHCRVERPGRAACLEAARWVALVTGISCSPSDGGITRIGNIPKKWSVSSLSGIVWEGIWSSSQRWWPLKGLVNNEIAWWCLRLPCAHQFSSPRRVIPHGSPPCLPIGVGGHCWLQVSTFPEGIWIMTVSRWAPCDDVRKRFSLFHWRPRCLIPWFPNGAGMEFYALHFCVR